MCASNWNIILILDIIEVRFNICPLDTIRKLNVYKTFTRCPGHLLNGLWTLNLRRVSRLWSRSFWTLNWETKAVAYSTGLRRAGSVFFLLNNLKSLRELQVLNSSLGKIWKFLNYLCIKENLSYYSCWK